jgi:hypothetical protein
VAANSAFGSSVDIVAVAGVSAAVVGILLLVGLAIFRFRRTSRQSIVERNDVEGFDFTADCDLDALFSFEGSPISSDLESVFSQATTESGDPFTQFE